MDKIHGLTIILLVMIITGCVYVINNCKVRENFEVDGYIDPVAPITPGETPNVPVPFDDVSIPTYPEDAPELSNLNQRKCSIYYVDKLQDPNDSKKELDMTIPCENVYYNKFIGKPTTVLQNDLNTVKAKKAQGKALTDLENTILTYSQAVINMKKDRSNILNTIGRGYCKWDDLGKQDIDGKRWVEPINNEYGVMFNTKNVAKVSNNALGASDTWAFCYKNIGNGNDTASINMAGTVADCKEGESATNCAIKGINKSIIDGPFMDRANYSRIAFKTQKLRDYTDPGLAGINSAYGDITKDPNAAKDLSNIICKTNIAQGPTDLKKYYIRFKLDNSNIIQSFRLMKYDNGIMMPYDSVYDPVRDMGTSTDYDKYNSGDHKTRNVYNALFYSKKIGDKIYLIADAFNVNLFAFETNLLCPIDGSNPTFADSIRINGKGNTVSAKISLRTNLGVAPIILTTYDLRIDAANKSETFDGLYAIRTKLQSEVTKANEQLTQATKNIANSCGDPSRINVSKLIPGTVAKTYIYSGNTPSIKTTGEMNSFFGSTRTVLNGTTNEAMPKYFQTYNRDKIAKLYSGYIRIPEDGNYLFMINCDDAGDFKIRVPCKSKNGTVLSGNCVNPQKDCSDSFCLKNRSDPNCLNPNNVSNDERYVATFYDAHYFTYDGCIGNDPTRCTDNSQKIYLEKDTYIYYEARFVNYSGHLGLNLLWQTPSSGSKVNVKDERGNFTCPRVANINTTLPQYSVPNTKFSADKFCFEEIPQSAFYYDNTILNSSSDTGNPDTLKVQLSNYNNQYTMIDSMIKEGETKLTKAIYDSMKAIKGRVLNLSDISNIDSYKTVLEVDAQGNEQVGLFMYIGEFEQGQAGYQIAQEDIGNLQASLGSIGGQSAIIPLVIDEMDINNKPTVRLNSPVISYQGDVSYTLAFSMYITDIANVWRNIIYHGYTSNNSDGDRTPGLWIWPGSTAFHFAQFANNNSNYTYNLTNLYDSNNRSSNLTIPLKQWFHFIVTVSKSESRMYYNGQKANSVNLSSGQFFQWNNVAKDFKVHYNIWDNGVNKGPVKIKNMLWLNRTVTPEEATSLYNDYRGF